METLDIRKQLNEERLCIIAQSFVFFYPFLYAQNKSYLGTEELAHLEMICAMVHQLTKNLSIDEIKRSGFDKYFVDHTTAVYPIAASSLPWRAEYIQAKGDPITDLHEDLAADGARL